MRQQHPKQNIPNFTAIPNWVLDECNRFSPAEFMVLLVIARKTYGWHKKSDLISLSQLEEQTGLSKNTVRNSIKSLLKNEIISRIPGKVAYKYAITGVSKFDTEGYQNLIQQDPQLYQNLLPQKKENINKRNKLSGTGREEKEKTLLYNINNSSLLLDTSERSEDVYNKEAEAGIWENDRETPSEIPEISTESDLEGLQNDFPTKGSRKTHKAPENGSKWKLPKFVTDQIYEICKALNEKFEHEMYWDSVDTKRLREQILSSGIDTENLRSINYNDISEGNPARIILEPFWRLERARKEKPENDFFWKPFRPSILSKKYLSFLPIMKYPKKQSSVQAEEEDVFAKAREVNKKLESR